MPAASHNYGTSGDFFLKIDGIEGESKDFKHLNEIDVDSWCWGETNTGSMSEGGGGGSGKVVMEDFNFAMKINKASPKLILACAEGTHIRKASLFVRKAGGKQQEYFTIHFHDLLISSYRTKASGSEVIPHAEITLNYSGFEIEYKEQMRNGDLGAAIKVGYDLKKNKRM